MIAELELVVESSLNAFFCEMKNKIAFLKFERVAYFSIFEKKAYQINFKFLIFYNVLRRVSFKILF